MKQEVIHLGKGIAIGVGVLLTFLIIKKINKKMKVSIKTALEFFNQFKGIRETDPKMHPFLYKLWRFVGYSDSWAKKAIRDRIAWSAVFISFVYKDYPDFPKSASHSNYIVTSRENTQKQEGKFRLRKINEYKPQVGDIVCRNRGGKNYSYNSIFRGAISHCDTIVEITPTKLITIGGNISHQVKITEVPINNGYVNKQGYFAIIQNLHKK